MEHNSKEDKMDLKIERQKFLMKKKGMEDISSSVKEVSTSLGGVSESIEKLAESLSPKEIGDGASFIVKGLKGDKGEKGDKGDKGEQGIQGKKGDKGDSIKGDKGEQGFKGGQGLKGDKGNDGLNGKDGKNGIDGKDGSPDSPEQIVSKLQTVKKQWLSIEAIDGDFNTKVKQVLAVGASGKNGIEEAPIDGKQYARKDADWTEVTGSGSGVVETIVAGTGISVDSTDPANPIVTNDAPDQTVTITGSGSATVTGTYPDFNVDVIGTGGDVLLDQTTPQTFINGRPAFGEGLQLGLTPASVAHDTGNMYWDTDWKTPVVDLEDDVRLQVGQETMAYVYNGTGSTLTQGQVVYTSSTQAGVPSVSLAQGDADATSQVLGVITSTSILDGAYGYATIRGHVNNIDTSAWNLNDNLYLDASVAGMMTNVKPNTGDYDTRIGRVMLKDASTGRVYVNMVREYKVGSVSAGSGVELFPDDTTITASGTQSTYPIKTLSKTPITTAEDVDTITMNNNTVMYGTYLNTAPIGKTSIAGGVWEFDIWAGVSSAVNVTSLTQNVNRVRPGVGTLTTTDLTATSKTATASTGTPFASANVNVGGTIDSDSFLQTPQGYYRILTRVSDTVVTIEVPATYTNEAGVAYSTHKKLFGVSTGEINNVAISPLFAGLQLYSVTTVQGAFTVEATDTLASAFFGVSTGARSVYFAHNGTTRYSHFSTPLVTSHNDLSGLNDGDYKHLTATQFGALHGVNDVNSSSLTKAGVTGGQTAIGGTGVTDILKLQGTSGNGTLTSPAIQALVGNNGGTIATTILNNGNVGIGTTVPENKTHISTAITTAYNGATLNVNGLLVENKHNSGGGNQFAGIELRASDNNATANGIVQLVAIQPTTATSTSDFAIITRNAGTYAEKMRILGTGNVGIGTTAPNQKLEVAGNIRVNGGNGLIMVPSGAGNFMWTGNEGGAGANIQWGVGGTVGTTPLMTLLESGNVGIGTTSPGASLDISNGLFRTGTSPTIKIGADIDALTRTNATRKLSSITSVHYNNASDPFALIGGDAQAGDNIVRIGGVGNYNAATIISLWTGATTTTATGTERMRIDKDGNVGIGTTAPTAVLHLKAGTATASTAPLKFTSGTLNTTAEAGAIEFLSDAYYGTITTGAARKTFAFLESPSFTTPNLGTPSAGVLTNATGLPAASIVAGTFVAGMITSDHGTATNPEVVSVVYGTGAAPTANTTPIGTLFIKYTA